MNDTFLIDPTTINITKLFPTPVAALVVPNHESLNKSLKEIILRHALESSGANLSNQGGWQSMEDFAQWSGPAGETLLAIGQSFVNQLSAVITPEHGLVNANLRWTFSAWANINHQGHSNALHGHPGSYWSGVYWVDDGRDEPGISTGGELVFHDPRGLMPTLLNPAVRMKIEGCLSAGLTHSVKPSSGTFLIFPSWFLHAVNRYEGARARVSVAFNFTV
ncbi:MAG: TIGR02466 family protein [Pseudomonas sp.]